MLALLFAATFAKGLSTVSPETTVNSLFLSHHDIAALPWIYVVVAIVSVLLGLAYVWAEARLAAGRLFAGLILFLTAAMAMMYAALLLGAVSDTALVLMV